ncbi:soybean protein regulated by cold-2 [Abeliophyllum distichum]|uniref:Soybean protein regulated by cold-2 n=1 Tax=Abeliophyllum distichum TaxID=126358 RepID=A0ABD1SS48_9LAMI
MECRKFEITLISADHLPDVRNFLIMKVYAKVSIKGESKTTKKTPVDIEGETNPKWNFSMEYTIGEAAVQQEGINVSIKLYCKRTFGDRFIGEVDLPLKKLFEKGMSDENISYTVSGTPRGRLNISYRFGERIFVKKPSGWRKAIEFGFLILVGGAFLLLKGQEEDTEIPVFTDPKDVFIDDNDVFYDACDSN